MHDENAFITLTYDQEHTPWDKSLNKKHFQDFMKRFRSRISEKIRYFHIGEYGSEGPGHHPHYHAIIFGYDFKDKTLWSTRDGHRLYTSEFLESLWPFGFSTTGAVSWESAAYCARYTLKKITGEEAHEHYWTMLDTDLAIELEPEYATMSLKPAIGNTWFSTYREDCFPSDYITHQGRKLRIPKYYDKLLARHAEADLAAIKENRKRQAQKHAANNTGARLRVRENVAQARLSKLKRGLEQ